MDSRLKEKQEQFTYAMWRYENLPFYKRFGKLVSVIIISLQIILAAFVFHQRIDFWWHALILILAFVAADFVNGMVHMIMDNNDDYTSPAGPLVAAFHLHHRVPVYKKNNIFLVYFNESGSKIWLAVLLLILAPLIMSGLVSVTFSYGVFYFAVFSSLAEVSHYLCHVSSSKITRFLSSWGLLLSKRRHGRHHLFDNVQYAFLNAMTDPVLDLIAKKIYPGYKNTTDQHYLFYTGDDTENRKKA